MTPVRAAALALLVALPACSTDSAPSRGSSGSSSATTHVDAAVEASRSDGAGKAERDGALHDAGLVDAPGAIDADGAVDGPVDVDNGAPSDVYPAPHPPLPQLTNAAGGPVLTEPTVYLIFYPDYPYVTDLQTFASNMTHATFWGETTHEYGVGPLAYAGTITLTGQTAPSMITQADLGTWVGQQIAAGTFGTPDPNGIYTVVFPQSTTITQPNPVISGLAPIQSCVGFGGYHDNVAVSLSDGGPPINFAYAVIPTCDTVVDDLTAVMSHEWVESSTDPFLTSGGTFTLMGGPTSAYFTVDANHAVWALISGGEAGDLCESEGNSAYISPTDVGYTVQRTWSNLLAAGSHDPCAPDLDGAPSFNSAPVLDETVTVMSSITGTIVSQGITIPVTGSKTIEVDLYSDANTGGPWSVTADDLLYEYYGSYGLENTLAFSWDRTSGVNGDKLHLTITVVRESLIAGAHAFVITSTLGQRQSTWPGLIVE